MTDNNKFTAPIYLESLQWHAKEPKGKLAIHLPKALKTQHDLALAYSPGVAAPCMEISKDQDAAYEYTNKGRTVAVISNGTAVLGLGDIGSLASKPVMEGKCALMKKFSGVDAVDIVVNSKDPYEIINTIAIIAETWGGINLEDIKAPECFIITEELQKRVSIPIFHDDQHGTAIVTLAGLINSLILTNRQAENSKVVINGAGAAAIACADLMVEFGFKKDNITMCDTKGVIYKGRNEGMNRWKEEYALDTKRRTLADALVDADILIGVSVKGAVSKEMVEKMADQPIIFAMANPDPEITPDEVRAVKPEAIVATGRSDYANQVNNVLCFPYIFRAALDTRSSSINKEMRIAAAHAIADLARNQDHPPKSLFEAYPHLTEEHIKFSKDYIIPLPFDERLSYLVPMAIARAAEESGNAKKKIADWKVYKEFLMATGS